ncbi:hypothetical protein GCM10025865_26450 [Paraoerskovia sediminicola]|uniref:Uncharacterized protein n=1 Tax=Paraoerskovia sediminicola TaxID=1138587 RepID=A0ABN6XES2_9CELL|nr:hypothetical protein [Paraoerskovia sediminicola]BDZ43346.1 hypothetical protein GCM10025865_26450 [Paraoerskovia sediminicola]
MRTLAATTAVALPLLVMSGMSATAEEPELMEPVPVNQPAVVDVGVGASDDTAAVKEAATSFDSDVMFSR